MRTVVAVSLVLAMISGGCLRDCRLVATWSQPGLFDALPTETRSEVTSAIAFDAAAAGLAGNDRLLVVEGLAWSPDAPRESWVDVSPRGAALLLPQGTEGADEAVVRDLLSRFADDANVTHVIEARGGEAAVLASRELVGSPTPTFWRYALPLSTADLDVTTLFASSGAIVNWGVEGVGASGGNWIFFLDAPHAEASFVTSQGNFTLTTRPDGHTAAMFGGFPDFEDAPRRAEATRLVEEAFAKAGLPAPPSEVRWRDQCSL